MATKNESSKWALKWVVKIGTKNKSFKWVFKISHKYKWIIIGI